MNDDILVLIKQYCTDHGCPKTAMKIKIERKAKSPKLGDVFKTLHIGKKRKIKVCIMNFTLKKPFLSVYRIHGLIFNSRMNQ